MLSAPACKLLVHHWRVNRELQPTQESRFPVGANPPASDPVGVRVPSSPLGMREASCSPGTFLRFDLETL